jgi:hypothetical protein
MRETTTRPRVGIDSESAGTSGIPEDPAARLQDTRPGLVVSQISYNTSHAR